MPGDIFDCHNWKELLPASRDAAKRRIVHRMAPTTKNSRAPNVSGAEVENLCLQCVSLFHPPAGCEAGTVKSNFLSGTLCPGEGKCLPVDTQPGHRRPPRVEGIWKRRAFQARQNTPWPSSPAPGSAVWS